MTPALLQPEVAYLVAVKTASFPVVLSEISVVTSPNELGGKIRLGRLALSRSVPSLPQSLNSASMPGDEAG